MTEPRPNFRKLKDRIYLVRTQAGFMQAVHDVWGMDTEDLEVYGFPTEYPCVVVLSTAYAGYHYLQCFSMHVNALTAELEGE